MSLLTNSGVILREQCIEGKETVERTVRRIHPDIITILRIQDQMEKVANFLPPENPLGIFFGENAEIYLVDDVGILVAADIQPGHQAHAHITFWDRRLRGREKLAKSIAKYVMDKNALEYLWTAIPKKSKRVVAFAERVGFAPFYTDHQVIGLKLDRRN